MVNPEIQQAETTVASDSFMLEKANDYILKLEQEVKNQTGEYMKACEKMTFYREMLKKLLDL